jgi:hypothetical protein
LLSQAIHGLYSTVFGVVKIILVVMIRLLSLEIYGLMHTTLVVVELIIIEVYGCTVFGVVGCYLNYIMNH